MRFFNKWLLVGTLVSVLNPVQAAPINTVNIDGNLLIDAVLFSRLTTSGAGISLASGSSGQVSVFAPSVNLGLFPNHVSYQVSGPINFAANGDYLFYGDVALGDVEFHATQSVYVADFLNSGIQINTGPLTLNTTPNRTIDTRVSGGNISTSSGNIDLTAKTIIDIRPTDVVLIPPKDISFSPLTFKGTILQSGSSPVPVPPALWLMLSGLFITGQSALRRLFKYA